MSDFARLMEVAKYYADQAPQNGKDSPIKDNNILEVPIVRAEGTINEAPTEEETKPEARPAPKAEAPPAPEAHRETSSRSRS